MSLTHTPFDHPTVITLTDTNTAKRTTIDPLI